MAKVKVKCGKCADCSPKRQKEVQDQEWDSAGKTPGTSDRTSLRGADGKTRSCPTWAVGAVAPVPVVDDEPEEIVDDEPEEPPASWLTDDGYGPKCASCGAGRGEDHCATCPYKRFEVCRVSEF